LPSSVFFLFAVWLSLFVIMLPRPARLQPIVNLRPERFTQTAGITLPQLRGLELTR